MRDESWQVMRARQTHDLSHAHACKSMRKMWRVRCGVHNNTIQRLHIEVCCLGSNDNRDWQSGHGSHIITGDARWQGSADSRTRGTALDSSTWGSEESNDTNYPDATPSHSRNQGTCNKETHNNPLEQLLAVINEDSTESTGNQPRKRRSTASTGNRSVNTRRDATHNRCRASLREAEIGRIGATRKQTYGKHGAAPHKTERLDRRLPMESASTVRSGKFSIWLKEMNSLAEVPRLVRRSMTSNFRTKRPAPDQEPTNIALEIRPKTPLETLRSGKNKIMQARDNKRERLMQRWSKSQDCGNWWRNTHQNPKDHPTWRRNRFPTVARNTHQNQLRTYPTWRRSRFRTAAKLKKGHPSTFSVIFPRDDGAVSRQ